MKATTIVTLFIITVLVAVGWSTVEVNASEVANTDKQPIATTDNSKLANLVEEQDDLDEAIAIEYNHNNNICYRYHLVDERQRKQQQQQQQQHEQCCVLFHKRQPPRKMGDIWIAVGLSTVFLFFMVLILQVFRNLEGQRKSCRKAHPVPIDDAGGLTNLLG